MAIKIKIKIKMSVCYPSYYHTVNNPACNSIDKSKYPEQYNYCLQGASIANGAIRSSFGHSDEQYFHDTVCKPLDSSDPLFSFIRKGCDNFVTGSWNPCSDISNLNPQ